MACTSPDQDLPRAEGARAAPRKGFPACCSLAASLQIHIHEPLRHRESVCLRLTCLPASNSKPEV